MWDLIPDPEIKTWAEGSRQTAEPHRHPGHSLFLFFSWNLVGGEWSWENPSGKGYTAKPTVHIFCNNQSLLLLPSSEIIERVNCTNRQMHDCSKGSSNALNDSLRLFLFPLIIQESHTTFCQRNGEEEWSLGEYSCILFLIKKFIYISLSQISEKFFHNHKPFIKLQFCSCLWIIMYGQRKKKEHWASVSSSWVGSLHLPFLAFSAIHSIKIIKLHVLATFDYTSNVESMLECWNICKIKKNKQNILLI